MCRAGLPCTVAFPNNRQEKNMPYKPLLLLPKDRSMTKSHRRLQCPPGRLPWADPRQALVLVLWGAGGGKVGLSPRQTALPAKEPPFLVAAQLPVRLSSNLPKVKSEISRSQILSYSTSLRASEVVKAMHLRSMRRAAIAPLPEPPLRNTMQEARSRIIL